MPAIQHQIGTHHASTSGATAVCRIAYWFWFTCGLKLATIYLFFQSDPQMGTAINNIIAACFLPVAMLAHGSSLPTDKRPFPAAAKWILALVIWSGVTLLWTQSSSLFVALGMWIGFAAEIAVVAILLRKENPESVALASLKGFCLASLVVGIIALTARGTDDLRIGDEEYLGPVGLSLQLLAPAALFSIFLALHSKINSPKRWWLAAFAGTFLLLCCKSKASIACFALAAGSHLLLRSGLRLRSKLKIIAACGILLLATAHQLAQYLDNYSDQSSNLDTLTGRTVIWATTIDYAADRPWLGYGFYSFRSVMPLFFSNTFHAPHAHNEWLQQWFNYGIVGLFITVAVYVSYVRQMLHLKSIPASYGLTLAIFALPLTLVDTNLVDLLVPLKTLFMFVIWSAASTGTSRPATKA
jgi:O-antigen ligase